MDRAAVLALARAVMAAGIHPFVAYELIRYHKPAMESLTEVEIEELGRDMEGWSEIDSFACIIAGRAWRNGRLRDRTVLRWVRSKDWRWRRAALVSTVPLNSRANGGQGDAKRTLWVCRMLATDRHDLIVKAVSWALRALSTRDPLAVRSFLAETPQLPLRVFREVTNKLSTGLKNPRRGTTDPGSSPRQRSLKI